MTLRPAISHSLAINPSGDASGQPTYNRDMARATIRPEISHSLAINPSGDASGQPTYNRDVAKMTLRPEISHSLAINPCGDASGHPTYNRDTARATIRPEINHSLAINPSGDASGQPTYNRDVARMTLRPEISHSLAINPSGDASGQPTYNRDVAKATLRPDISHSLAINTYGGSNGQPTYNRDKARKTLRPDISHSLAINLGKGSEGQPTYNRDIARMTLRPEISHSIVLNTIGNNSQYVAKTDVCKNTMRENLNTLDGIISIESSNKLYVSPQDELRQTNRTLYEENTYESNVTNQGGHISYIIDENNKARATLRQEIEDNRFEGIVSGNADNNNSRYVRSNDLEFKTTIKEQTLSSIPEMNIRNNDSSTYMLSHDSIAKETKKETTHLENYSGALKGELNKPISTLASSNMSCNEKKESTIAVNYTPNGAKDLTGPVIDRENVQLRDYTVFTYVPNPHVNLDYSVIPTPDKIPETREMNDYKINKDFISALDDNPLVNDIYHNKSL
jgi:hypothetical protein